MNLKILRRTPETIAPAYAPDYRSGLHVREKHQHWIKTILRLSYFHRPVVSVSRSTAMRVIKKS